MTFLFLLCLAALSHVYSRSSLLRAGRRTLHFGDGKMVIEHTVHLIWDIFFFQNLTEAIYILRFTIHLHQRNAEIITNIRNLKQQVGICNNVDTLHILGHRAPILTTHIVNKHRIMYVRNTMTVFGRIFVLVFQALDAIHDIGVIIKKYTYHI